MMRRQRNQVFAASLIKRLGTDQKRACVLLEYLCKSRFIITLVEGVDEIDFLFDAVSCGLNVSQLALCQWVRWINEYCNSSCTGYQFTQQLQALCIQQSVHQAHASDVAPGPTKI